MKRKIYILLHHEIMYGPRVDEMVFGVWTSMSKVIDCIKKYRVAPYSWWEIQEGRLDGSDWPEHVGWYGLKGGKLEKEPYNKALKAYGKIQRKINEHLTKTRS